MQRVFNFFKTIRKNWKKSVFATVAISYGINYGNIIYNNRQLMKQYCIEAAKLGDIPMYPGERPYRILVILNTEANKSKAKAEYEKYCFPILHLSGSQVTVVNINSKTDANFIDSISLDIDALIIAGGNGTVSESLTGLLRRLNGNTDLLKNISIGILPLGKTNSLANKLYHCSSVLSVDDFAYASSRVRLMAEAAFAAIKNRTGPLNIMKIENLEGEIYRPVYGVSNINWGAFRDARARCDQFHFFVKLRSYLTYIFGPYKRDKPIKVNLNYYSQCSGCKYCYQQRPDLNNASQTSNIQHRRWWQVWVRAPPANQVIVNYDEIENELCKLEERKVESINLSIIPSINNSHLVVNIGPPQMSYTEFVKEGWKMVKNLGYENIKETFYARQLIIEPLKEQSDEKLHFSIDDEEYDLARIKVTLLTNAINIFRSPQQCL